MIININTGDKRKTWPGVGDVVGGTLNPDRAICEAAGWRDAGDPPEVQAGYVRQSATWTEAGGWQVVDIAQAQLDAEAAAAEAARINGLAWKYGGMVGALAAYLARVGWTIPCEAEAVTADLLQRDLGGALTADQKDAKSNVADTYMLLTAAGLSNPDIAAIWERVKP
jgi:hypothetical protein